jgi:hypothetical protein
MCGGLATSPIRISYRLTVYEHPECESSYMDHTSARFDMLGKWVGTVKPDRRGSVVFVLSRHFLIQLKGRE